MSKGRILLLTRHYPPVVSGGARRPFLLANGLRARGWRVTLASPQKPDDEDDWIETPHPAGRRGDAAPAGHRPAGANLGEAIKRPLRSLLYWPDNDMRWALSAVKAVTRENIAPEWVISTSPPESAHLAGRLLQRATGARWLAEMRDSWIADPLRPELRSSALRRSAERLIAKRLMSRCDRLVAVSEAIAEEASAWLAPDAPAPLVIGHFAEHAGGTYVFEGKGPHLLYTGRFTLSHPLRTVTRLLDAFAEIRRQIPGARLHLVGMLTEQELAEVSRHSASGHVTLHGEIAQQAALAMQAHADALILYQQSTAALPGKLSEYLLSGAPILALGDGPWRERLSTTPHFPIEKAAEALAAPRRTPANATNAALDAYEQALLERPATTAGSKAG